MAGYRQASRSGSDGKAIGAGRHRVPLVLALAVVLLGGACSPAPAPTGPVPAAPVPAAAAPAAADSQTSPAPGAGSAAAAAGSQTSGAPAAAPQASALPVVRVPPPPAAPPATLDKVTYGIVSYNPFHWVAMVAQATGMMKSYGIDFDLLITRTAPAAMSALASGSLDLATTTPGASWDVQRQAPGLKQVMEIISTNPYTLLVQPEIASYDDLRGQTVAGQSLTSGADIEVLRLLLDEHGLQYPRDYDILAIGSVAEREAALLANQAAAAAMIPPNTFELLDQGKRALDEGWKYPSLRGVTTVNVLARESWYQEKPDVARRFVQAYVAITAWLYDPRNRDEAIQILAEQTRMEPKYAERTYQQFVVEMQLLPANPRVEASHLAQAYTNLKRLGLGVPDAPMALVDNSLVDGALE